MVRDVLIGTSVQATIEAIQALPLPAAEETIVRMLAETRGSPLTCADATRGLAALAFTAQGAPDGRGGRIRAIHPETIDNGPRRG